MSFYSSQNLSRQGPLRLLWTAAHLERQLKRQQVRLFVYKVKVYFSIWVQPNPKAGAAAVDSSSPGAATEKAAGAFVIKLQQQKNPTAGPSRC
jgi:hypothetical protein